MGELQYEIKNGVLKAHINPENDLEDIQEVSKIVEAHGEVSLIRIDMYRCSYIQSRFLAGLVAVKKLAMVRKITIELLNVSDHIAQVLQSTNLQKLYHGGLRLCTFHELYHELHHIRVVLLL